METVTKIGYCRYCHNQRIVEVPKEALEEEINDEATEACDCIAAKKMREREYQKGACIANIEAILTEKHPEIAELFKNSIDAIQERKIQKITINTHLNQTARLYMCKDGIKVELEKKQKTESLA